jgi:hypothetical protein
LSGDSAVVPGDSVLLQADKPSNALASNAQLNASLI